MVLRWVVVFVLWASGAHAELNSLFVRPDGGPSMARGPASLFSGAQSGMFAPLPDVQSDVGPERITLTAARPSILSSGTTPIDRLLSLIAQAEAGSAGYDAVQYGARVKPSRRPTDMTLGEIYAWIEATPGQPHAIGRYQFIPDTLRRVAQIRGFGPEVQFSAGVQDVLALVLLEDAGLEAFQRGEMDRREFMRNLARIWAGLPLPNGRSYYHGYAGNAASMTWAAFEGGMVQIWGS